MSKGPLAVRYGAPPSVAPEAGTRSTVSLEVENTGALRWNREVFVSYHWLDARDNPIVWDGVRTGAPVGPALGGAAFSRIDFSSDGAVVMVDSGQTNDYLRTLLGVKPSTS